MFKTDILFTGFYGQKNTGDDAFVEVASWGSGKFWNKTDIRFLARHGNLPCTITPLKGYPFSLPKTYFLQANLLTKNTNYLISAGGSTIHSKMKYNDPKMIALKEKTKNRRLKLGGIGVSIGPFNSVEDEKAVQKYLKSIDFIATRDQASFAYLESLQLPYKPIKAFDLAALLPDIYNHGKNPNFGDEKIIGVSVCPVESLQKQMDIRHEMLRNDMIVELLKKIDAEGNVHFKFYVINGHPVHGDLNISKETIAKVNPKRFELVHYDPNTEETWKSIADCDFMISTRLHAAIFACFANTPFVLNEYHRKCMDFLDDVGYPRSFRLGNSQYSVDTTANQILDVLYHPDAYSFPTEVEEMKNLAYRNFTEIAL